MSALSRILSALEEAPSTAAELALVADIPPKSIHAHLSELQRMGLAQKGGRVQVEIVIHRRVTMWERITAGATK